MILASYKSDTRASGRARRAHAQASGTHDDDVLQTAQARQEKKDSRKKLASNLSLPNLFRAATQQEDEKEEPSRPASPALIKDDALAADAEEEAAQVLIDDDFKWIASDVSILVRLRTLVCSGLEEHIATDLDESSQNFRLDRALKTMPKNSSDSKLQVKPRKRSLSPQPLPVHGMKRNQSSEALIDQLIEKHIRKNEASPPPPPPLTDTPRVAGRPPRPPRARSVGSLQAGSPPSA